MNEIVFEQATHTYRVDGVVIPSVTQALKEVGIIDFSMVPASRLDAACAFGTAVHKATELWDRGTLDYEALDANIIPYLEGWIKFCKDTGFTSIAIELPLYSKLYRFCGMLDRLGTWRKNTSVLIADIKTGVDLSPATAIQTAGYEILVRENEIEGFVGKRMKTTRISVLLNSEGTYKIEEYKDKNDANVFIAALSVFNWRIKNGK